MNKNFAFFAALALLPLTVPAEASNLPTDLRTLSAPQTTEILWSARVRNQIDKDHAYEKLVMLSVAQQYYQDHPQAEPADVLKLIHETEEQYQTRQGPHLPSDDVKNEVEVMNAILDVAVNSGIAPLQSAASVVKAGMRLGLAEMDQALGPDQSVIGQMNELATYTTVRERMNSGLKSAWEQAQNNPRLAAVVDTYLGRYANALTSDSATAILENNREFASTEAVRNLAHYLSPDGKLQLSLEQIVSLSKTQQEQLLGLLNENQKDLNLQLGKQAGILEWLKARDQAKERGAREEHARQELRRLETEAAGSTVFLLSSVAGFLDPQTGRDISVIGNSIIQAVNAVERFTDQLSVGSTVAAMGTAVLTGNLVSVAMNVLSLFGSHGPDPFLQQIQKLQEQLNQLGESMNRRFDQVDTKLNVIYSTMIQNFTSLQSSADALNTRALSIQGKLLELEIGMSAINEKVSQGVQQLFRATLDQANAKCTLEGELFRGKSIRFSDFRNCLELIASYANTLSKRAAQARHSDRDPDQISLMQMVNFELATQPFEADFDLLAIVAKSGFGHGKIPAHAIPNPIDWIVSVQAYLDLTERSPEFRKLVSVDGLERLSALGQEIKQAQLSIGTRTDRDELKYDGTLFKTLIQTYRARFQAVQQGVQSIVNKYASEKLNGYDLLGGPGKNEGYLLTNGLRHCRPELEAPFHGKYQVRPPEGLRDLIPVPLQIADRLGLGKLRVCLNQLAVTQPGSGRMFPSDGHDSFGVDLAVLFNDTVIIRRVAYNGELVAERNADIFNHPQEQTEKNFALAVDYWNNRFSQRFIKESIDTTRYPENTPSQRLTKRLIPVLAPNPVDMAIVLVPMQKRLEEVLPQHLQILTRSVQDELTRGNLAEQMRELTGAKALLQAFVSAGLPRSFETNDVLRGLLSGSEAVYDSQALLRDFFSPGQKHETALQGLLSPAQNKVTERIDALEQALASVFSQENANEPHPLIDPMLRRLKLLAMRQRADQPSRSPQEAIDSIQHAMLSRLR